MQFRELVRKENSVGRTEQAARVPANLLADLNVPLRMQIPASGNNKDMLPFGEAALELYEG